MGDGCAVVAEAAGVRTGSAYSSARLQLQSQSLHKQTRLMGQLVAAPYRIMRRAHFRLFYCSACRRGWLSITIRRMRLIRVW